MIIVTPVRAVDPGGDRAPTSTSLTWTWTAPWLGRTWALSDVSSSVLKLRGATGLGQVDPLHMWSDSPAVDGSVWSGVRHGPGLLDMAVFISGATSEEFLAAHDSFMETLDPARECLLRVTRPDGSWREARCRYESGADAPIVLDPVMAGRVVYSLSWVRADPYWSSTPVVELFSYETALPLFPGPPFGIGSGRSLTSATTTNPGDVAVPARWRANGPFTSLDLGVGTSRIMLPIAKPLGGWVVADLDPSLMTVTDETGANLFPQTTQVDETPIPPGEVDLVTTVAGASAGTSVELTFTPKHRRAY